MPHVVTCPQCATSLRIPDTFPPGANVKCPKCSTPFPVPGPAAEPAAVSAQPMAPPPMSAPRTDDGVGRPPPSFSLGGPTNLESLSANYMLDFGAMFSEIGKNYGSLLGPMIGFFFLMLVIIIPVALVGNLIGLVPLVGSLISSVVMATVVPQLSAGGQFVTIKQMRGQPWSFGDFFAGFRFWVSLFTINVISGFVQWVCFLPMTAVTLGFQFFRDPNNPDPTMALVLVGLVFTLGAAGFVVFLFVYLRYLMLAPYLAIDGGFSGLDAIKGNAILSQGHIGMWFVTILLAILIGMSGAVLCGIGVIFTMPIMFILTTALYLHSIRESGGTGV